MRWDDASLKKLEGALEVGRGSTGPQRSGIGGARERVPVGPRRAEAVAHGLGGQRGEVAERAHPEPPEEGGEVGVAERRDGEGREEGGRGVAGHDAHALR